ncbi:carboxymuconolactone decarboxylase family protein [Arenibacter sp. GZD96]|uniref:carboxymuconolactone decarboxylase family protein n=1 Tax=Aurantibrevibacter litoralis TaxID=3106030 RepID=UPI002AFE6AD8|nr:carboxymuconolactone decarboxylase family protein [Arenibacter sp. GZD-96]MEA1785764.1 carboxymuconolactone decarboxylase family protein [Arenibacter sp. GZD-96]
MSSNFRITLAAPEAVAQIEKSAPQTLKNHFELIKEGLTFIPGVPREAVFGAVTLRALALKPDIFTSWFLTEYHSVKQGEIDTKTKELLAFIISKENEGNECAACAPYHEAAARFEGATPEETLAAHDFASSAHLLPQTTRTLIEFGLKAAFRPKEITDQDVSNVKSHGISDKGLIELASTALIAYNLSALNQIFNLKEGEG